MRDLESEQHYVHLGMGETEVDEIRQCVRAASKSIEFLFKDLRYRVAHGCCKLGRRWKAV